MKRARISFEKGVNNVVDKALAPDGYATILDNVDLRSGSPRPFRAPEFQHSAPAGTTRHFQYRGKWHYAPNWRDYLAEFIGGIERVYYTEEGQIPMKNIEGDVARLGTPRPTATLGVTKANAAVPGNVRVGESNGSGIIEYGDYYYAVSARTEDGILNASPLQKVTLDKVQLVLGKMVYTKYVAAFGEVKNFLREDGGAATDPVEVLSGGIFGATPAETLVMGGYLTYAVDVVWEPVEGATSYVIWKGDANNQYLLDEVDASVLLYRDDGTKKASGGLLSDVVGRQEFQYVYTYSRDVGGVTDESGISYPSIPVLGEYGRKITRDVLNDGYFANNTVLTGTASAVPSATNFPPINLYGGTAEYNNQLCQTKFILSTTHGFSTEDKVLFPDTLVDPNYKGQTYKVVADSTDAKSFYVRNRNVPTDVGTLNVFTTTAYLQPVKTKFTNLALNVGTNDAVFITYPQLSGTTTVINDGLFQATPYLGSTAAFTVPLVTTSTISSCTLQWVANNGFYKSWNLYRNEQGGWFKVKEVDMWEESYTDYKPFSALDGTPTSYYTDNGQVVDYEPAPLGLKGIESHYGMLFGIDGHKVRWTPILQPDAWPETFSVPFAYQPVALASYSQGLIVLCEDAIYRIDGNQPTLLSVAKTRAEDGCIAAHSVQKTQQGLVYLSKRGIMIFDGMDAKCITDTKISASNITGPSKLASAINFWWLPTVMSKNYADMAGEYGIRGDQYAFNMDNTNTIQGINKYIKSFYHLGKYYLFYTGDDYQGNTTICIDLQLPGYPITTLGMKALDAHVNEVEQAFVLLNYSPAKTTVTITSPT